MKSAIIIGSGSYVLEDSFGSGVILPSLLELSKQEEISSINICVRTKRSEDFWKKVELLKEKIGALVDVHEFIFEELEDLMKLKVSNPIAFVAVPDDSHFEYVNYFISEKIPVWVVKPLTGNGKLSKSLVKKAIKLKVPLWVDYHKRFDVSNRKIKQFINSKQFGEVNVYSVQYSQPSSMPLSNIKQWAKDVDVFQYIGCHYVDQIFYLFPSAIPLRVSSTGISGYLKKHNGPEYDVVHVLIDFLLPNNKIFRGDFNIAWNDPEGSSSKSHQRVEVQFENGRIIADQKERGFQVWNSEKTEEVNPYFFQILADNSSNIPDYSVLGYGFESIKQFVDNSLTCDGVISLEYPWGVNTYKTDIIIDASKKSLKLNGNWIEISQKELNI